ncbi:hypothetical protein LQ953_06480 [Sphingomonas sp. IC-56]|nr:hypothetical protein [Sphingomonas sp. IC-56]MCD2323661.1 hypothetical protein [Sphingomonas sp. IC-56]
MTRTFQRWHPSRKMLAALSALALLTGGIAGVGYVMADQGTTAPVM